MPNHKDSIEPGQMPGFFVREIQIQAVSRDEGEDDRTLEIAFSSETPVERWGAYEVLDHSKGSVDMGRFENNAALLADHNWRDQIGAITKAWIDEKTKQGRALVKFSRSARGQEFYQDVLDGIRTGISVGYEILEAKLDEIKRDELDVYRVTRWRPLEASIVSVPADYEGSGVGREVGNPEIPSAIQSLKTREAKPEQAQEPEVEAEHIHETENIEVVMNTTTNEAERQAGLDSERARVSDLMDAGEKFGAKDLADQLVRSGGSIEDLHLEILNSRGVKAKAARSDDVEIGLSDAETGDFRLTRLIYALANPTNRAAQKAAGFELEASQAAQEKMERMGSGFADGTAIPFEVLTRSITAGGANSAGELIEETLMTGSFIDMMRNRLIIGQAGATTLTGLVGNLLIPRQTNGASAYWIANEGADTQETDVKFDQIALSPKHLGCFTEISAQALLQSSMDVESLVRNDLATAIATEIDRAVLYGTNSQGQPNGLTMQGINTMNFAAEHPSYAELVEMETRLATANADEGNLRYLATPSMRGYAKTKEKFENTTSGVIWEPGGMLNGYTTGISNQIKQATKTGEKTDVFFGNWRDVLIGYWGSMNLLVDPYSNSKSGTVRIVARQWMDTNIRHPESFVHGQGTR